MGVWRWVKEMFADPGEAPPKPTPPKRRHTVDPAEVTAALAGARDEVDVPSDFEEEGFTAMPVGGLGVLLEAAERSYVMLLLPMRRDCAPSLDWIARTLPSQPLRGKVATVIAVNGGDDGLLATTLVARRFGLTSAFAIDTTRPHDLPAVPDPIDVTLLEDGARFGNIIIERVAPTVVRAFHWRSTKSTLVGTGIMPSMLVPSTRAGRKMRVMSAIGAFAPMETREAARWAGTLGAQRPPAGNALLIPNAIGAGESKFWFMLGLFGWTALLPVMNGERLEWRKLEP
jgi:hypothetical protein